VDATNRYKKNNGNRQQKPRREKSNEHQDQGEKNELTP